MRSSAISGPAALRSITALLCLLSVAASHAQTPLAADSGHFAVYQGDKVVGASDYTIQTVPKGFNVTSRGQLKLTKFSYSFSNAQHLDGNLNLVSDQLSGNVNGSAVTFGVNADSTGRQFQINISANGKQTQNSVDRHQHLVLLPDLDSAAYVLLTQLAITNPPTSWILIPKENGILVPSSISRSSSVRGQLNGTQIDVQHATISVNAENSVSVDIFFNSAGQLLEADLPQQNFFVVRDGFKLINRPKPAAPSAPPPASPQQGGSTPPQYPAPRGGTPQMLQQ